MCCPESTSLHTNSDTKVPALEDENAWEFPDDSSVTEVRGADDEEIYDEALDKEYSTYDDSDYGYSSDYGYDYTSCPGDAVCSDMENCFKEGWRT